MAAPELTHVRMLHPARRGSSSSSAHGLSGRIASCVLDPLGRVNPRPHVSPEATI